MKIKRLIRILVSIGSIGVITAIIGGIMTLIGNKTGITVFGASIFSGAISLIIAFILRLHLLFNRGGR